MAKIPIIEPEGPYDKELERRIDELLDPERVDSKPEPKKQAITVIHETPEDTSGEALIGQDLPITNPEINTTSDSAGAQTSVTPTTIQVMHEDDVDVPSAPLVETTVSAEPESTEVADDSAAADDLLPPEPNPLPVETVVPIITPSVKSDSKDAVTHTEPLTIVPIDFDNPQESLESPLEPLIDDEKTEAMVREIVAEEADELLAVQDLNVGTTAPKVPAPLPNVEPTRKPKVTKKTKRGFIIKLGLGLLLLGLLIAMFVPVSRNALLNAVGVRAGARIVVIDQSTQQPLKNASVTVAGVTAQTDVSGVAQLNNLRIGPTTVRVEKRAFAATESPINLWWGNNQLADTAVDPTGSQYVFRVVDYVTGKPVAESRAVSAYADANADDKGVIKLTLENNDLETATVDIMSNGFRTESIEITAETKESTDVKLVVAKKHVFVSNRSGTYDVYSIDIDGKNETVILPGTGSERDDMLVVPSPTDNVVAIVSARGDAKNKDGFLLSTLNIIDLATKTVTKVSQSEQIHIIGWNKSRVAYVQTAAGASAANPDRERLMSYDVTSKDNKQLLSANYFNDVMVAGDYLYYAPSTGNSDPNGNLTRMKFDGSDKKVLLIAEVWNALRVSYDKIVVSVPGGWYEHTLTSATARKLESQPPNTVSRTYVDNTTRSKSAWIENRDGKGTLLSYDTTKKQDTVVQAIGGLQYPIRWASDTALIYRVSTQNETADYLTGVDGGKPRKISDVTNVGSSDRWYYY